MVILRTVPLEQVELPRLGSLAERRGGSCGRSRGTWTGRGSEPRTLRTAAAWERAKEATAVRQSPRGRLGGRCPVSERLLLGLRDGLDLRGDRVVEVLDREHAIDDARCYRGSDSQRAQPGLFEPDGGTT